MSGERRRLGQLPARRAANDAVRMARTGLLTVARALRLAALIPAELVLLVTVLVWVAYPAYGVWVALTVNQFTIGELVPGYHPARQVAVPIFKGSGVAGGSPDDGLVRIVAMLTAVIAVLLVPVAGPALLGGIRRMATVTRALAGQWAGVAIGEPYQPYPGRGSRLRWMVADPATWRDLGWLVVNCTAGAILLLAPVAAAALGAYSVLRVLAGNSALPAGSAAPVQFLIGVAYVAAGLWAAPPLLRAYGYLARSVLARPGTAELNRRISHLAQTRSETIDASAAEIRRIERDLHDGAQARLVAIGMALDAAGQLLEAQPETARALLMDARENSAKALAEIRGLVRGIHPPVLADRGLPDAVRALALDTPQAVRVHSDLAGRLPAPVESAVYFAVSELLVNVAKHADARQARVDIRHDDGTLVITVADDGHGGADPDAGTGLRGVSRRLAAFDGELTIDSPPGGPTRISLELPCALS
jgi:signal transduction histidine kinase